MAKHTQAIRRQFTDELFECIWPFYGIGALRVNLHAFHWFSKYFNFRREDPIIVDSDSSDEILDYPSFKGDACIPLFFCFLFENQLFNLIQFNVIFSPTITDKRLKLQKKLTQKPKSKDIARTICGY